MGKTVDLDRLATTLRDYRFTYVISVDNNYHAHTTTGCVYDCVELAET